MKRHGHLFPEVVAWPNLLLAARKARRGKYRNRVVGHAVCNVIEPIFERGFIGDSYACRRDKGTHAAVDRAAIYTTRFSYVLKTDIERFFPLVDHQILLERVAHRVKDATLLRLIELVGACPARGCLPPGRPNSGPSCIPAGET